MSQAVIVVKRSGPLSLIQDYGRFGLAHIGITQGGPVDDYAYCWANHLLKNPINSSVIEITYGHCSFVASEDCHLAICGGDLSASIDDVPLNNWSDFLLRKNQTLEFGHTKNGLRTYLAIKGGFSVKLHLGSTATVMRESLGGIDQHGSKLKSGDVIPFQSHHLPASKPRQVTFRYKPDYNLPLSLRIIEGYQFNSFCSDEQEKIYSKPFAISNDSNRMGYKVLGTKICPPTNEILSEGIALGAIQVPPDGYPIILLNDHQTIGGYPKLGCIARIDLPRLAQAKPGQSIRFVKGNRKELQAAWVQWARFFGY
ncbi:5-oxoprolinase subunit C family protein [Vibrio sagamiensis]|uniref:Allophanate hydrolase n=1 Tax=Vibrio sagamiensis NBRC 104589 TaxID=1219064 RepID=A0A511QGI5_9VIBR|nr:biotin-dependent carboxyltransferase family protein [Vibrio sagamiensis]PNQ64237.1 allophanate hydrolase [Vibrio agarivorans]GEM76419.1 allophanate hydrolase [Vibrio sagamiensis NBRC 104589]